MEKKKKRVMLIVLDGWGIAEPSRGNAIFHAQTPTIDELEKKYFSTTLQASGIAVGLSWGEEGNSEVGHMNIGAGFIVYQYLPRITNEIRDGAFFKNQSLLEAIKHVKHYKSRLHIMGLVSSGTVHSSIDHLYGLLELARKNDIKEVVVHAFTDGKDSGEKEAAKRIEEIEKKLDGFTYTKVGSVVGRMYAMDRNNNWDLTKTAYELLTRGVGNATENAVDYIKKSYETNVLDFDIAPVAVHQDGNMIPRISENDALVFFNFREDSTRQLTKAFVLPPEEFPQFTRAKVKNLFFVAMTEYAKGLPVAVAYPPPTITTPLAKVLSDAGYSQLHIAETEKYAHVTFFINGEHEVPYPGEKRILIPSTSGPHYGSKPEMEAYNLTQKILEHVEDFDFYLINFANADLLGHGGDYEAVIKGVEALDANISALVEAAKTFDITLVITADHGNAEGMRNLKTGEIEPQHTLNPVPLYIIGPDYQTRNFQPLYEQEPTGILADVAPTILKIIGLPIPKEMTGKPRV